MKRLLEIAPGRRISTANELTPPERKARIADALRKAGMPE
jgi:hypothetical protein